MNWEHPWVCQPPPEMLINTAHRRHTQPFDAEHASASGSSMAAATAGGDNDNSGGRSGGSGGSNFESRGGSDNIWADGLSVLRSKFAAGWFGRPLNTNEPAEEGTDRGFDVEHGMFPSVRQEKDLTCRYGPI